MNIVAIIFFGIREVLGKARYALLFLATALFIFSLFVFIPAISVPGNSFSYQLSLFSPLDFGVTIFLSVLYALFVTMQAYILRRKKQIRGIGTVVGGGVGSIVAGVTGTAFCASCLAPLFALFGIGFGGVIFILEYRFYFVGVVTLLMFIAIYLSSKKIAGICKAEGGAPER